MSRGILPPPPFRTQPTMKFSLIAAAVLATTASAIPSASIDRWAVLVAGSSGYENYRHQSDVCHALTQLVANGVPRKNIITMLADDIASSDENPFNGSIYNAPTNAGDTLFDVYPGCVDEQSYTGENVTAANFLAVITGNSSAATGTVLQSTENSHVLIAFFDHGAGGLVCFPAGPYLYADELGRALATMEEQSLYGRLVIYIEACESGSMFPSLPTNTSVYATTAANAEESSWGTFCPPDSDIVNGTHTNTCLGDLYSINWMGTVDANCTSCVTGDPACCIEPLDEQTAEVTTLTNLSHVQVYGDVTDLGDDAIGEWESDYASALGNHAAAKRAPPRVAAKGSISSRTAARVSAVARLSASLSQNNATAVLIAKRRLETLDARAARFTDVFDAISHQLFNSTAAAALKASAFPDPFREWACYRSALTSIEAALGPLDDAGLTYARLLALACTTHDEAIVNTTVRTAARG